MKNLLVIALMTSTLFMACKRNKMAKVLTDTNVSTTTITTTKPKTNISDTLRPDTSVPPQSIADVFKVNYPNVKTVTWEQVNVPAKKAYVINYKAYFMVGDMKHLVVYDKDGNWIESREQILPDQLPQNIFAAIKKRYPSGHIKMATTYKNIQLPGTYAALVKPQGNEQETEVILQENGSFVK